MLDKFLDNRNVYWNVYFNFVDTVTILVNLFPTFWPKSQHWNIYLYLSFYISPKNLKMKQKSFIHTESDFLLEFSLFGFFTVGSYIPLNCPFYGSSLVFNLLFLFIGSCSVGVILFLFYLDLCRSCYHHTIFCIKCLPIFKFKCYFFITSCISCC